MKMYEFISPMFEAVDAGRRRAGRMLEGMGLGPGTTPSRTMPIDAAVNLLLYEQEDVNGPVLLIVPAPIKRAYIWDLVPRLSVVRQLLQRGVRPYLMQWQAPEAHQGSLGLDDYADRLVARCLDGVEAASGQAGAILAGHSLGGTLAAIFAARHPRRVRGLVLVESPLHFGPEVGDIDRLATALSPAGWCDASGGRVAGSILAGVSYVASPVTFGWWRWRDWLASLGDREAMGLHLRVERWSLDELPIPARLLADIVQRLYQQDQFMRGTLEIGGQRVGARQVSCPALIVLDPRSRIVPPSSMLPFLEVIGSGNREVVCHYAERGTALEHLGSLVGPKACETVWPRIIDWIQGCWSATQSEAL